LRGIGEPQQAERDAAGLWAGEPDHAQASAARRCGDGYDGVARRHGTLFACGTARLRRNLYFPCRWGQAFSRQPGFARPDGFDETRRTALQPVDAQSERLCHGRRARPGGSLKGWPHKSTKGYRRRDRPAGRLGGREDPPISGDDGMPAG
jgi:hypothetical protein